MFVKIKELASNDLSEKAKEELLKLFCLTINTINFGDYSKEQVEMWGSKERLKDRWSSSFDKKKIFVCCDNGKYLGFCELDDGGYIDRFYVAFDSVGKGVGRKLYYALETSAEKRGIEKLCSNASITAKPFFEKLGFSVIAEQKVVIEGVEYVNYRVEKKLYTNKYKI
jgi:GNAT superfamily N-acetyltransferase